MQCAQVPLDTIHPHPTQKNRNSPPQLSLLIALKHFVRRTALIHPSLPLHTLHLLHCVPIRHHYRSNTDGTHSAPPCHSHILDYISAGDPYKIRMAGDGEAHYGAIIQLDGLPREADFPKSPFTYFKKPYDDPVSGGGLIPLLLALCLLPSLSFLKAGEALRRPCGWWQPHPPVDPRLASCIAVTHHCVAR